MKTKQKFLLAGSSLIILGGALLSTTPVQAETAPVRANRPFSDVIGKLSERFNLNQNEVETVFNEVHQDRERVRLQDQETRLTQLVEEGTMTEEQKQSLIQKKAELGLKPIRMMMNGQFDSQAQAEMTARREEMAAKHEELEKWAAENGIDPAVIAPQVGVRNRAGRK